MAARLHTLQVPIYLAALAAGAALGLAAPAAGGALEPAIWPALAVLMAATFTQVPLVHLGAAARDRRFMAALLAANFAAVPALAWLVTRPLAGDDALLLGALLVLLAPCVDWFVPFARAGGGDGARAAAATPLLLGAQLVAVPAFLVLFAVPGALQAFSAGPFLAAFAGLVVLPGAVAAALQAAAGRAAPARGAVDSLAAVPVPALAVVLALVAASQVEQVRDAGGELAVAAAAFAAFAVAAPVAGAAVARAARLPAAAARTVVFSAGTRNSFVVLPLALALPEGAALAAAAVVTQTLVELVAMSAWVRAVPRLLVRG